MILLPAIDLLGGKAVRLFQGRYDQAKSYSDSPSEVARAFQAAGARQLHVVDLDAARGQGHNRHAIRSIRHAFDGAIQVGGGIRSLDDARQLAELGVNRLVLGTILVTSPETAQTIALESGAVVLAGIDAKDGQVRIKGWEEGEGLTDLELARRVRELRVRGIVYTNISRDGTLGGADLERTLLVQSVSGLPIIMSGGVAGPEDLKRAAESGRIAGVILGKALYEGALDLAMTCSQYPQIEEVVW